MADKLPSSTLEPSGNNQPATGDPAKKKHDVPKQNLAPSHASIRKKSKFPNSKRVDFAAALGLVVWVWSEMMVTHDFLKLCVQWLILVIFYFPVCYYVSKWRDNTRIGYVLFITLSLVTAAFAYRNTFSPAFSIIPREQYVEMKTPRHFIEWNINGRVILSPINVIMLAQFTNLRDEGMTINSYQFEGRTTNGTWEIMPTIDIKMGSMVSFVGKKWGTQGFGIVFGPLKEGDVATTSFGDDVFPRVFIGKTITSGGTVAGVIFLEGPKQGFDGTIRCRIRDAVDREFVELVSPLQQTKPLQTKIPMGVSIGPGMPDREDIKNLPIVPWSQEWRD
jgi:hypothetical protein